MVASARKRLGDRGAVAAGDLNTYEPPEPVAATTVFRAIYYADEAAETFFRRVAEFTTTKLVFDLNPRQFELRRRCAPSCGRGSGRRVALRPFLFPQRATRRRARFADDILVTSRRAHGPAARLALRWRFTYLVAAFRGSNR